MPKQLTRGGMKTLRNQQGNILILGVFLILIISILFAGLVEFGRIMIVREQLQTAADSAALAGAGSGTHRYVKINVVTDRGDYTDPCCTTDDDGDCIGCCSSCGEITIHGIVGNEKELIDEGGWQEFCVPPCDCSPGDCWFELVDRKLMYDTHSMGWGSSSQEIKDIENELTMVSKEVLAQSLYGYTHIVKQMVEGMSLSEIQTLLSNQYLWQDRWMAIGGYQHECCIEDKNYECLVWKSKGYQQYNIASSKKHTIDNIVQTINNINHINNLPIQKIDAQYTGASDTFFNANLPQNAVDSEITKLKVYGYENRNSPYYPSVVVYATAKIKTLFPQWFNNDFATTVCAQGTTAYRDREDQIKSGNKFYGSLDFGKWRKLPDKACWEDW